MSETFFYNSKNLVGVGSVGIGTTNPAVALDVYTGTMNAQTVTATTLYGTYAGSNTIAAGNIYSSNALSTTNVFGTRMSAGGFAVVAGGPTVGVAGNVYASNALSTTNVFATQTSAGGFAIVAGGPTVGVAGNVYASNALSTTNVFATQTSAGGFAIVAGGPTVGVAGNIYASNALSTTNVFASNISVSALIGPVNQAVFMPQDFSPNAVSVTPCMSLTTLSTSGPFIGEGSIVFGATDGSFINFGTNVNGMWPGGGRLTNGTIEFWLYQTARLTNACYIMSRASSTSTISGVSWYIAMSATGALSFGSVNTTSTQFTASSVTLTTLSSWNHVAITVFGGLMTLYLNGTAGATTAAFTGSLRGSSSYILSISAPFGSANQGIGGSIAGVRLVTGTAVYTTNFTPPTSSLRSIQGSDATSNTYGTVLLLQHAPVPGRIQVSRLAGTLGGTLLSFPPATLSNVNYTAGVGYTTTLTSGYGQGAYVAIASTEYAPTFFSATNAFNEPLDITQSWVCQSGQYNAASPYTYAGNKSTVDKLGNSYPGEWVQLTMPVAIVLSSYTLVRRAGTTDQQAAWCLLGSFDGVNWDFLDSRTGVGTSSLAVAVTYNVSNVSRSYNYFRYIITSGSPSQNPGLSYLKFNGVIESVNITADGRLGVGVVAPTNSIETIGNIVAGGSISGTNVNTACLNAAGGNVGIGVTNPAYQLDLSTDGARKSTSTVWLTGSDVRIKTDIQPANIQRCYDIVKSVELKYFKWNFPAESNVVVDDKHSLGFIAQEIQSVFPNAVTESNSCGYVDFLSLNTDQILKAMYGALRQTMADKEALEQSLANVVARLAALEAPSRASSLLSQV